MARSTATARVPVTPETLRSLADYAGKGTTYDEAIRRLLAAQVRFTTEADFQAWFVENLGLFGFSRVVRQNRSGTPDLILEDKFGKNVRVEIEYDSAKFIEHGHSASDVDMVVAARGHTPLPVVVYVLGDDRIASRNRATYRLEGDVLSALRGILADRIERKGSTRSDSFPTMNAVLNDVLRDALKIPKKEATR